MEKRLQTLLYNAIGYMIEDMTQYNGSWNMEDVCDEIANYLGSTIDELTELGVLDYEELTNL